MILDSQARVPRHVVYRDFVNETVVLNLETGTYTASTAQTLVAESGWEFTKVERDLVTRVALSPRAGCSK
jgi:hypothetical protein